MRKTWRRRVLLVVLGFLTLWVLTFQSIWRYGEADTVLRPDCVAVIASGSDDCAGVANHEARARRAAEAFQTGKARLVLVLAEARRPGAEAALIGALAEAGVPAEAVRIERRARTLREQARALAEVMAAERLRRPALVADFYALHRMNQYLHERGIAVQRAPLWPDADFAPRRAAWAATARETLVLAQHWFEQGGWRWVVGLIGVLGLSWSLPAQAPFSRASARIIRVNSPSARLLRASSRRAAAADVSMIASSGKGL